MGYYDRLDLGMIEYTEENIEITNQNGPILSFDIGEEIHFHSDMARHIFQHLEEVRNIKYHEPGVVF